MKDLRFAKLAVSIVKCPRIYYYFFNVYYMYLALRYFGLDSTGIIIKDRSPSGEYELIVDIEGLEKLFQKLYNTDPNQLAEFIQYSIQTGMPPLETKGIESDQTFQRFQRELLNLGIRFDVKNQTILRTIGHEKPEDTLLNELEQLLQNLNSDLLEKHQGMWEALESDRKDSIGQAISSARELLSRLLRKIGEGKTRKEKTLSILKSNTKTEFVEAYAQLVDTLYDLQSKGEHDKIPLRDALFVLKVTDYVVYYLLKSKEH